MIFIARGALFIMSVFEKAWMCFSSLSPVRSTNSSQLKSCVVLIFAICISVSISFLLLICIHSSSCSVIPHTQCAHTWFHCVSLTHTFTLFSVSLTDTKKSVWCHTLLLISSTHSKCIPALEVMYTYCTMFPSPTTIQISFIHIYLWLCSNIRKCIEEKLTICWCRFSQSF